MIPPTSSLPYLPHSPAFITPWSALVQPLVSGAPGESPSPTAAPYGAGGLCPLPHCSWGQSWCAPGCSEPPHWSVLTGSDASMWFRCWELNVSGTAKEDSSSRSHAPSGSGSSWQWKPIYLCWHQENHLKGLQRAHVALAPACGATIHGAGTACYSGMWHGRG